MNREEKLRAKLRVATRDLVGTLLYYDRKEDEELSREDVEEMIRERWVTKELIVEWFSKELRTCGMFPEEK